jgi:hypothetical protein
MRRAERIAEFWGMFERQAGALARVTSADDPVYEQLFKSLQRVDSGLYLEFHAEPGASELIITAQGESKLFDLVESVYPQPRASKAGKSWR